MLTNVLNKSSETNKEKELMLKRYFVAFMNDCDKCDSDKLKELDMEDLESLGIDNLSMRKAILKGLKSLQS